MASPRKDLDVSYSEYSESGRSESKSDRAPVAPFGAARRGRRRRGRVRRGGRRRRGGRAGALAAASDTPQTTAGTPGAAAGPVVVYLRDAASGELDVFAGTSHAVIRDHQLAARLTSAVRPSAKRG